MGSAAEKDVGEVVRSEGERSQSAGVKGREAVEEGGSGAGSGGGSDARAVAATGATAIELT